MLRRASRAIDDGRSRLRARLIARRSTVDGAELDEGGIEPDPWSGSYRRRPRAVR